MFVASLAYGERAIVISLGSDQFMPTLCETRFWGHPPPLWWYIRKEEEKGFLDKYGAWGGGGKVSAKKKSAGEEFFANSQPTGPDFHPFRVIFSGFQLGTPSEGWNWGKPRPQNRGIPCCQPLGPTFGPPAGPSGRHGSAMG